MNKPTFLNSEFGWKGFDTLICAVLIGLHVHDLAIGKDPSHQWILWLDIVCFLGIGVRKWTESWKHHSKFYDWFYALVVLPTVVLYGLWLFDII